jgi:glycosyltransferase involved in cell wall biosynthesis
MCNGLRRLALGCRRKMKVLCLSRYPRIAANTRYRVAQFLDQLSHQWPDLLVDYVSTYSESHFVSLQASYGSRTFALTCRTLSAMVTRCIEVRKFDFDRYDAIIATSDLLPWLPFGLEARAYRSKPGVVVDLDDARWLTYSGVPVLSQKYAHVLASARHVIAGNAEIARYARRYTDRVTIIPTVVDVQRYIPKDSYDLSPDGIARVAWIGTSVTAQHLLSHQGAFRSLALRRPFTLECIGVGDDFRIPGVVVRAIPWSAGTEAELLRSCDVGVMPLPNNDFAKGKSGLKIIQYLSAGLPVLASAVGANCDIINEGHSGLLSRSIEDFRIKLDRLLAERDLRAELGIAGRNVAMQKFSLQSHIDRFAEIVA